jgi:hypothetical protein
MFISASANCFPENILVQPVVITELKFSDIERQVFPADLVIGADNTALHQRPEALNRVRMQRADHIPLGGVIDSAMVETAPLQIHVTAMFVRGDQGNLSPDRLADEVFERGGVHEIQHASDHFALPLDSADNGSLGFMPVLAGFLAKVPVVIVMSFWKSLSIRPARTR